MVKYSVLAVFILAFIKLDVREKFPTLRFHLNKLLCRWQLFRVVSESRLRYCNIFTAMPATLAIVIQNNCPLSALGAILSCLTNRLQPGLLTNTFSVGLYWLPMAQKGKFRTARIIIHDTFIDFTGHCIGISSTNNP
jgi:hypothetical protein